jgi:hypothetical protein
VSAPNVFFSVQDPDRLRAGQDPLAPFQVAKAQLYRYVSEAAARANSGATLVTTFDIVASTTEPADPNIQGPFRYGTYDSGQQATSWYRYRFADDVLANFSALSEPWPAEARGWALRDLLFEVGDAMGGTIRKGVAATNTTANLIDCAALFKSTKRDARFFEGWWALCSEDAGGAGAAPEGEERLIESVSVTTGIATVDRDFSVPVTAGDTVLLSALLSPLEMVRIINRVREQLRFLVTVDIALDAKEDRYPMPYGVWSESDIIDGVGIIQYANSNREAEFEIDYRPVFDGFRGYLEITEFPAHSPLARFRVLRSYRDLEGELTLMSDTTQAPIEWLRPAVALAIAEHLLDGDPSDSDYQAWRSRFEAETKVASGRYAPDFVRRARRGSGRRVRPGPVEVW